MKKPTFHILVCNSYRIRATHKVHAQKGAQSMIPIFHRESADRGIDAIVRKQGCLNVCSRACVVGPSQNLWYGGITTEEQMEKYLMPSESGGVATE